jgi:hypothetical protein
MHGKFLILPIVLQGQIINKMNVSNKLLGSLTMEVVDLNEKVRSEVILAKNIGETLKKYQMITAMISHFLKIKIMIC